MVVLLFCKDMKGYSVSWTKHKNEPFFSAHHTRRQHQCIQANHVAPEQTSFQNHSLKLAASTSQNTLPMLPAFVALLLLLTSVTSVLSHPIISDSTSPAVLSHSHPIANQTFRPALHKLRRIRAHLKKINKPAVKTIEAFSSALETVTVTVFFFFFISSDSVTWVLFFVAEPRWGFDRLCFISSATSF